MNKGIFHTLAAFAFSSALLLPASAKISATLTSPGTETPRLLLDEGGLFHAVPQKTLGGAYSSNRLKGSSRRKFTPRNVNRVRLRSKFPRKLGIANYDVAWTVKSLTNRTTLHSRGKVSTINIPPGKYRVTLRVGTYRQSSVIRVRKSRNNVQSFSIPVKAGLLKVKTNNGKSMPIKTRITVKNSAGKTVAVSNGHPIKRLLHPGKYTVDISYNSKRKGRNIVHITNGSIKETTVKMPRSSKVRLRAFERGNQPLMKRSSWVVYNAEGKEVSRTKTRTHRLSLLPGTYTAQLTVGGRKIKKKFKVASGQNRTISIHL